MNPYAIPIREAERRHAIPSGVLFGVLQSASHNFNADAIKGRGRSQWGSIGIAALSMQDAGDIDRTNPFASIERAALLLAQYRKDFGSWATAAIAYKWGKSHAIAHLRGKLLAAQIINAREYLSRIRLAA